jgi:hypothetical protein
MQPINEDDEQTDILSVIRPLAGIESNKYQPIIRQITSIKVAITPFPISPITKRIFNCGRAEKPKLQASTKQVQVNNASLLQKLDLREEESTIVMYDQSE